MRKTISLILSFFAVLAFCSPSSSGQTYSYGMDAGRDSMAVNTIRAKLDSIRKRRPTVALVLSGGGAKGAAHIGVFKQLEEMKIPVDIVMGTSMGGLMGGMYSLGYSSSQIDSIIRTLDWGMELSDNVPPDFIPYSEKEYKRTYLLSMPFFYAMPEFDKRASGERDQLKGLMHQMDDIHLGVQDRKDVRAQVKDNLLSSLPSGFVYGQNVNNLFSSLTAGYQDDMAFWELPVPFVCVATEMVSGKAKVWYSGRLNSALRSTMAIPGLFTPVNENGMVLLDGGMRDNYPTDIARNLGADYVIGVDLSSGYKSYDELKNLSDILMQGSDMLGRASYENNVPLADVTIKPDMMGYNMLSFDPVSIDTLIRRGYAAAKAQEGPLAEIKAAVGRDSLVYQGRHAYNLLSDKVLISGVEIDGVSDAESLYLMERIGIKAGQRMDAERIDDAVATIYGTKAFDYVTYELSGREEPFRLKFHCRKGPINHLGVGMRADSDEIVAVLLNLGFNVHNLSGHALSLTGKIGSNPYAKIVYYYKTSTGVTVNASAAVKYVERNKFSFGENLFNISYYNNRFETYLSNMRWKSMNLNVGIRSDYYRLGSLMVRNGGAMADYSNLKKNVYLSAFLRRCGDTFDDGYFPSKGTRINFYWSWVFGGLREKISAFHTVKMDFKTVARIGDFAVLPFVSGRFLFGSDVPSPYINVIGGRIAGRYFDQQIPFMGVTNAAAQGKFLVVAGSDFRFRVARNNYVTAIVNVADSAMEFENMTDADSFSLGAGLEYAYNSVIGPIRADIHWSSISRKVGCYIGVGFDF